MTRWLALLAAMLLGTADASAQQRCWRPDPPSCIDRMRLNRDAWQFNMCRSEVLRFQQEVQDYVECQRRDREDLLQDLDEVIRRFNTCARSEYC